MSLKRGDSRSPWSLVPPARGPSCVFYCQRPRAAMLHCTRFSQRGYENYTLGDATQQTLREIWTGPAYSDFPQSADVEHAAERLRALRTTVEPLTMPPQSGGVTVVIPTFNEAESIAAVIAELHARHRQSHNRGRWRQHRRHAGEGAAGRRRCHRRHGREVTGSPASRARKPPDSGSIVVFMDGDGADDPAAMEALVAPIRAGAYDFVIASRAQGRARTGQHGVAPTPGRPGRRLPDAGCSTVCAIPTCAPIGRSAATPCSRSACAN